VYGISFSFRNFNLRKLKGSLMETQLIIYTVYKVVNSDIFPPKTHHLLQKAIINPPEPQVDYFYERMDRMHFLKLQNLR